MMSTSELSAALAVIVEFPSTLASKGGGKPNVSIRQLPDRCPGFAPVIPLRRAS